MGIKETINIFPIANNMVKQRAHTLTTTTTTTTKVFIVDFKKLVVIRGNKFKNKIFFHEKISSQLLACLF